MLFLLAHMEVCGLKRHRMAYPPRN